MGKRNQISGESHYQKAIRKCIIGEQINFVSEPDNKYDPTAVKVCRTNGETIGYVTKQDTGLIKPFLSITKELGLSYKAWIKSIGKGGDFLGVTIDYKFNPTVEKEFFKRHYLDRINFYKKQLEKTKSDKVKQNAIEKIKYFEDKLKKNIKN